MRVLFTRRAFSDILTENYFHEELNALKSVGIFDMNCWMSHLFKLLILFVCAVAMAGVLQSCERKPKKLSGAQAQADDDHARSLRLQAAVRGIVTEQHTKAIEAHKVCQGMSEAEVRTSLGAPDSIEGVSDPDLSDKLKTRWMYGDESVFFDYQDKVLVATHGLSW